ncbi:hypothetical protein [Butyrivibrio proteoclasticus]|uniref:hypothetical protein n=1 Tax=Butyrivibrio proteoclasticus TaxID=43305 RepID=UPI0004791BFE|nr:hypothetical protein [Butyrivibrio proteoclasticus]
MKKNNLLSAITIGISAMMVLQSPVSAYASENLENLDSLDNSNPGVSEEQAQPETPYEPITEDVQSAADTAIDACVSTPAAEDTGSGEQNQPAQEQQAETNQVVAQVEVQQAADIILNGDSESGTPSASEQKQTQEVKDLISAATAVAQDSTDEEGNKVNSAVTSYEEAAKDIADAKENLAKAEEANKEADAAHKEAVTDVTDAAAELVSPSGIVDTANNISGTVSDANKDAEELVESIEKAESEEEATQIIENLETLITTAESTVQLQKEHYDTLSKAYNKAIEELTKAQETLAEKEEALGSNIDQASSKISDAEAEVAAAQQKVDNLGAALEAVENMLDNSKSTDGDILDKKRGNNWSGKFTTNVDNSRNIMKDVVVNYYLPQVAGKNIITNDPAHPYTFSNPDPKNVDYEHRYTTLEYYYVDDDGSIQKDIKYFNWDSISKSDFKNQNIGKNEGNTGIVMYEKTLEEVNSVQEYEKAMELAKSYYADNPDFQRNGLSLTNGKNLTRCIEQGWFNVYTYMDGDEKKYIVHGQLTGPQTGTSVGETPAFTSFVDENGIEHELTLVPQPSEANTNGLYKNANCLIIGDNSTLKKVLNGTDGYSYVHDNVVDKYGISEETITRLLDENQKLNDYITDNTKAALVNRYANYRKEVDEAKSAAQVATDQVTSLKTAMETVEAAKTNPNRNLTAKQILNVESVAEHLGLEVSPQEAEVLNLMNMTQLKEKLQELKAEADKKIADALDEMIIVRGKKDKADQLLKKLFPTPDPEPEPTPSDTPTTPDGPTTPTTGGTTTTPAPDAPTTPTGADAPTVVDTTPTATPTDTGTVAPTTIADVAPALAATPAPAAPAVQTAVDAPDTPVAQPVVDNQNVQPGGGEDVQPETVEIDDGTTPLADSVSSENLQANSDVHPDDSLANPVDILDDDTALSSTITDSTQKRMSWWWLLIIALLGATGKKMYDEHMAKKEEKDDLNK